MMFSPLVTAALGSIIRFGLAAVFGYLVQKGIWSEAEAQTYLTAAVLGVLTLSWSLWSKYRGRLKLLTALATPRSVTENQVEMLVAEGFAPPAATSKDQTPHLNG